MTIYHIPSIPATALPKSVTVSNIQAGFKCTGIYPYNRNIFTALDYAPSCVTDRPLPTPENDTTPTEPNSNEILSTESEQVNEEFSPEIVRPFCKAPPRKVSNKGKKGSLPYILMLLKY